MGAAWSEISFVVPDGLISQELKKLQQAESLPFCPILRLDKKHCDNPEIVFFFVKICGEHLI